MLTAILKRNLFVSLFTVAAAAAVSAQPATYHEIKIPGADQTQAMGINNHSQIVGSYQIGGAGYGFLLSNGKYKQLEFPGGNLTSANAINDSGEIVGSVVLNNAIQGFTLINGTYQQLSYPGYTHSSATGVNNAGVVVGNYWDTLGSGFGFKYANGEFSEITIPNATNTQIGGINNNGDISGSYFVGSQSYGFILRANGDLVTISYPGATGESIGTGINSMDQAVGDYVPNPEAQNIYGYLYSAGSFMRIAYPGAIQTIPEGVNNSGVVVGAEENKTAVTGFWVDTK
jgi:hypothetical protein